MMYFLFLVFLATALWCIGAYNHFVGLSKRSRDAWADIERELKRRYDLISELSRVAKETVLGEETVFANLTRARAAAMSATTREQKASTEQELSVALKAFFGLSETYPELAANEVFLKAAGELSEAENKIQAARRFYNAHVRDYTVAREKFPGNAVAAVFGFKPLAYFELGGAPETKK